MKVAKLSIAVGAFVLAAQGFAQAHDQGQQGAAAAQPTAHVALNPQELKWGPPPPGLAQGAKAAVLDGDISKGGKLWTARLKLPAGYTVPPHTHPSDEYITVISGQISLGHGSKVGEGQMKTMGPGAFFTAPTGVAHYVKATKETVLQVQSNGPFEINHLNPADDPRNQQPKVRQPASEKSY